MRILHVVPSYVPAWRYGGPIRSVHGLCKALAQAGHDVEVYTTNADGPGELDVPVGVPVDVEGVKVWYFCTRMKRLYWSPAMGKALERNASSFSLIHLHSIYLWPTLAGARVARRKGIPYVLSPRGMLMAELIRGRNRLLKTAWIQVFERANLAHAAATHFTSSKEAADAHELDLEFKRVVVVPNGLEAQPSPEVRLDSAPELFSLAAGTPFVLFIGRLSWEKGLDRLIAALREVPGHQLVIAGGTGDQAYRVRLETLAVEHAVAGRVRFVGEVHGAAKAWLLDNADMLVLPSYSESFGNVVLEAMAASCPVVVTPEVGASEVVRESGCGAVLSGEPVALGRAINALLADPDKLRQMALRGRTAFQEKYTWHAVARRMAQVYEDIIARAPAP